MKDDDSEKQVCVQCFEELNTETYFSNPYGMIGEINQTKLFYFSRKQTYEKMMDRDVKILDMPHPLYFDSELN
jgi:hypothetical protein